jgi:hypothetical protein
MNKYAYLTSINSDAVKRGRGIIQQLYPETVTSFVAWDSDKSGCGKCKQKAYSRAILLLIMETPKGNKDVSGLKKALPADFVDLL